MSGNSYYNHSGFQQHNGVPNKHNRSDWSLEQQQFNEGFSRINHPPPNHASNHAPTSYSMPPPSRSINFYSANNRHYQQPPPPPPPQQPIRNWQNSTQNANYSPGNPQPNWPRNNQNHYNNKRPRAPDSISENFPEFKNKSAKKKKKPLSQNVPSKKDWTPEEADLALSIERDYNKRHKNHSLIIKFPDLELNRDIVSKFHSSIENVHFQQPSTPRFCFVTLKESADAEQVMKDLNTIKFGNGLISAEFKKDREDDQNIGPEDIDPLTLYVGNLAQEITKEDMVKTYPMGRRIDIGYAKKMKYTRYAFVSFKCVTDAIAAFRRTHSTQMYSKSLIVRFRRLHGTVGMPGESKPQSPAKSKADAAAEAATQPTAPETSKAPSPAAPAEEEKSPSGPSVAEAASPAEPELDLSVVKQEVNSSSDEEDEEAINLAMEQHKPIRVKQEIKQELPEEVSVPKETTSDAIVADGKDKIPLPIVTDVKSEVKREEDEDDDYLSKGAGDMNFDNLVNQLVAHSTLMDSLRKSIP